MSNALTDNNLTKSLSLLDLIFFGLGNVTGAGVFVLITKTVLYSGKYVLPIFVLVTIITIIMGFIYLEIFNRYKSPICEYLAIKDTLGDNFSQLMIYIIYLFVVFSALTIIISLSKYIGTIPYFYFLNNYFSQVSLSIALILLMSFINYCGIETSKFVANTIAIGLLIFLCGIIFSSINYFSIKKIVQGPVVPFNSIVLSAIIGFFLFNGFDAIVKISDEVVDENNVAYGLIITLLISSIIYILIIISCLCVMGFKNTVNSESPLTKMYELLYNPQIGFLAYICGLIIMFNTAFLSALTATRFMFSCANENYITFPDFWKQLNSNKVPSNAIIVTALIAIVFSLFNNEVILAIFTNFSLFIILITQCISLLIIRWNERTNIDKQLASNYILGNINNIPLLVVLELFILLYLFYKILVNNFYLNYKINNN
jgi:APA family basic amino acid/polyamine antiporter